MKNKTQSLFIPFSIIALVNLVFYLPVILKFPGFIYDDFKLFAMTSHNSQIISTNPNDIFYFFVRPVSYIIFKLDYLIWGNNYLGMKIFTFMSANNIHVRIFSYSKSNHKLS